MGDSLTSLNSIGAANVAVVSGGGGGTSNQGTPAVVANAWPTEITDGVDTAQVTGAGALKVDGSATTQPVSGAVSVSNFPSNLTDTQLRATAVPVSGAVSVSNLPATQPISGTVASTQSGTWTVQPGNTANTTAWKVDGSAVTQPVSGPITDTQLRASAVPVTVSNFPATQPVSGAVSVSNFPATQPVSGPVTDTQLRASAVPVTVSNFPATQPISGAVSVSNFPATQPISGTVAATQSGTWTIQPGNTANTTAWKIDGSAVTQPVSGPVTDTQLRASAVPVVDSHTTSAAPLSVRLSDGSGFYTASGGANADTTASGTLNALNTAVSVAMVGKRGVGMQLAAGTLVGTIIAEVSYDGGTTWAASLFLMQPVATPGIALAEAVLSTIVFGSANTLTTRSIYVPSGVSHCRVRVSAFTSGTAALSLRATDVAAIDPSINAVANPDGSIAVPGAVQTIGGFDGFSVNFASVLGGNGSVPPVTLNDHNPLVVALHPRSPLPSFISVSQMNQANGHGFIGLTSLGTDLKTVTMKSGSLVSTAVTADQVILTYSISALSTFFLQYIEIECRLTTFAATATLFGTVSLEHPAGTKFTTVTLAGNGFDRYTQEFAEPLPFASTFPVIRIVCTPSATTSFTWRANFGGFER